MVDPNPKGRFYKVGEIVLTPYPAESDRKDVNICQGKIIKKLIAVILDISIKCYCRLERLIHWIKM